MSPLHSQFFFPSHPHELVGFIPHSHGFFLVFVKVKHQYHTPYHSDIVFVYPKYTVQPCITPLWSKKPFNLSLWFTYQKETKGTSHLNISPKNCEGSKHEIQQTNFRISLEIDCYHALCGPNQYFKGRPSSPHWVKHGTVTHCPNGPRTADTHLPQGHVTTAAQEMLAMGISKLSAGRWAPFFQKDPSHEQVLSFHSKIF
jgi:hypothetical protein